MHSPNSIMASCTRSTHPVPRHYSFGLWLTSIILFTAATTPTTKGCVEGERDALLDFKTGIVKDPSSRLSSWRGRVDCCRWSGVVCDNRTGHVVELNLHNSDPYNRETSIGGEIRPSLLLLTHLERLNLSHNDLSTDGLHWLSRLTSLRYLDMSFVNLSMASHDWLQAVNMLSSLEELHLPGCRLTDLPSSLSHVNLTALATLDLHGNHFNSTFPDWLWKLHNLSYLDLSSSMFHGAIPAGIGNLTGLRELYLGDNSLSGPIPTEIGIWNSLKLIDLSGNSLFGPIPDGIKNLTRLRKLFLSYNSLSGPVPTEIGIWNSLEYIDLSDNSLLGPIPAGIGNLTGLRELNLNNNSLSDPVPTEIGIWNSLEYIDLSDNSLLGPIPAGIGNLTGLRELNLNNNSLSGPVPTEIGNLNSIEHIDLSGNLLSGTIPTEIGKLSNLIFLSLSSNSLEGTVSELHFDNLTELSELDLSENSLVISVDYDWVPPFQLRSIQLNSCKLGPAFPRWLRSQNSIEDLGMSNTSIEDVLPDWFWNNSAFSINLSQNQINGTLSTSLEHMTNLSTLKLGMNLLEGPIPRLPPYLSYLYLYNNSFSGSLSSISLPLELELLDLSRNHISGNIPSFICNLTQLLILDLSSNQISGEIPWCWQETNFLFYINLADNKLSGEIPSSFEKLTQLRSLHLNNNSLHGHLPLSLKHCSGLVFLDLGDNKFSGTIPTWIAQNFQKLEVLRLCSNMFFGNIPIELGQLHHLHIIDLANNNLSGPIPRSFGNLNATKTCRQRKLTSLDQHIVYRDLDADRPAFDGTYDDSITLTIKGQSIIFSIIVYLVNIIDFSNNNLIGEIPLEIGSLSALQTLNLSRNNFVGQIPTTIGGMKSLETLDLSFNKLSGGIPRNLSDLYSLNHLNLSYNNLSGVIPSGNQLQTLNVSSIYIGNAYLCGAPLNKSCYDLKSTNVIKEDNKDGSFMLSYYLSIILGYLVGLWSVFIIMLFKKNWRVFYFQMFDKMYDKAYVVIKIRINRLTSD
ncbi:receptor-like protein EIX2 [Musa acuminata AAA Group]|uniref:receptor-like protein EIX2 n=1 Tax=Musa acuminata AAA Group TaxID=214697 RepID=UPI0031DED583